VLVFGSLVCVNCSIVPHQHEILKATYDQSAQYHLPDRNPIIVIPGILGSRLVDDESGQTVWGAFRAEFANPNSVAGAKLIALPLENPKSQGRGNVRPDGVLESLDLNLLGFPITIQAYAGILETLGVGGYRDDSLGLNSIDYGKDHFTCFQFDYDWRRDIPYNAAALHDFIEEKRLEVQAKYRELYGVEDYDLKFDIVAHSMGGLVTRYYLRYGSDNLPEDAKEPVPTWAGAKNIERAILVAPPNAGSLEAFDQLLKGFDTGRPLLPRYNPVILGTFPSIYQLLPRSRHKPLVWDGNIDDPVTDILNPDLWQRYGWGLSASDDRSAEVLRRIVPDQDPDVRKSIASDFQSMALNRAKQFHAAMDVDSQPPSNLEMILVTGDATKTPDVVSVNSDTGEISILRFGVGDKTVLRSSALLDERVGGKWQPTLVSPIDWSSVLFIPKEHRKITNDHVFEDNVLYWLLEAPRDKLRTGNDLVTGESWSLDSN